MKKKYVLITGSDGLVGSECVEFFCKQGFSIIGLDNNYREKFFGKDASVLWNRERLKNLYENYYHFNVDITNNSDVESIFKEYGNKIELIIHCAAQPSHDWAAKNPLLDFQVNSFGTLNLLENTRKYSKDTPFIFTSTNKVYGDNPNKINLIENKTRFTTSNDSEYQSGFNENFSIDNTMHSLFGVSKLSADVMVQEYGKYFNMKTVCFRGGCLTGPNHSGTVLHGFLSYLMKCTVSKAKYTIFGYKGKQVRDNIHSSDLTDAFYEFYESPRSGEVYNIGGGLENNCSMLEAISFCEEIVGSKLNYTYSDENRMGDHKWYVSDLSKFKSHYPKWSQSYTLHETLEEIAKKNSDKWSKQV
jgi:CDP-paratose 2-epimerase